MRSSLDKHRDMARSILPSRHRRLSRTAQPRARRRTRRIAAAEVRELTRHVHRSVDGWLDYEGDPLTYEDEIPSLVRWRRQGDKLHHFERWAVMSTRHLPIEDRLPALRRTLPDTLPGRHALGHLQEIGALGSTDQRWSWLTASRQRMVEHERRRRRAVGQMRAALHDAIDHGDHGALNRALRQALVADDGRPLLLRSRHDVEGLLAALADGARARPVELRSRWDGLVRALDESVDGWRFLPPMDGPDPFEEGAPRGRRDSSAAGLSWLPPITGGTSS